MQRPSRPAAFADVESVGKDLSSIAVCIYLHARLEIESFHCLISSLVIAMNIKNDNSNTCDKQKLQLNPHIYLKGIVFHKRYVLFIDQCVFCLRRG